MEKLVAQWREYIGDREKMYPQIIGESFFGIYGGLLPTYGLPVGTSLAWLWLEYNDTSVRLGVGIVAIFAAIGLGVLYAYRAGQNSQRQTRT
jgi:hypothetical protein